jgi:DNA-binding response OmpR family regulator
METRQHHVLYIEDHDDTRELVTLVLAERNYRVTTGSTVVDALKLAREQHFDLYMLDSWLPDGSGIDLCKTLRELDPGIPIMFLSGAAYEADKESAINSGAQGYLIKPADLDVLCSEVSRLIDVFPRKREPVEASALCSLTLRGSPEDDAGFELSSIFHTATFKH